MMGWTFLILFFGGLAIIGFGTYTDKSQLKRGLPADVRIGNAIIQLFGGVLVGIALLLVLIRGVMALF
jgi:hypothetical protein